MASFCLVVLLCIPIYLILFRNKPLPQNIDSDISSVKFDIPPTGSFLNVKGFSAYQDQLKKLYEAFPSHQYLAKLTHNEKKEIIEVIFADQKIGYISEGIIYDNELFEDFFLEDYFVCLGKIEHRPDKNKPYAPFIDIKN